MNLQILKNYFLNKKKILKPQNNNEKEMNKLLISQQKDKELISQLNNQITKLKEEMKTKDNLNKINIEKLKKQLSEANIQIGELIKMKVKKLHKN